MGMMKAIELAEMEEFDIFEQVRMHLSYNCYPPAPEMTDACVNAIDLVVIGDPEGEVKMPEGVAYRGQDWAPAEAIVENFRLWAWV